MILGCQLINNVRRVSLRTCGVFVLVVCSQVALGARPAAEDKIPQVARIREEVSAVWKDLSVTPSAPATDHEWCRRVYLDVIGRVPSVTELRDYLADKNPDRRRALVNKLLHDEVYLEEYSRNWTTIWTNILIGRSGGTEDNSLTNRAGMQKYLRDSFVRNKPYDRMVRELVTATGNTAPGTEDFNGATNFLAMKVNDENGVLATAATSRIFLGLQVQCTQCHDHPFNKWKQQQFWDMNSFFRQARALRQFVPGGREIEAVRLVNEDFGGEGGAPTPEEAEVYYERRNGLVSVAYPVFVDGQEIARSGLVQQVVRRDKLADLMLDTSAAEHQENANYLEKTIVNRMWGHFLGYGFTKPVDDMGPHNPPSHPALLNYLGLEFRKVSYDLKQLIEWIVLSEPYALGSKANSSNASADDPALGEQPKFSRFYLRQMRAEELYESLMVATRVDQTSGSYEEQEKAKTDWLQQFTIAFGNDEGEEATTFNGTIPQALMMFNGDLIKKATSPEKGSFLWQVAADEKTRFASKVSYLFQAALARIPSKKEAEVANELLNRRLEKPAAGPDGAAVAALEDIWWALLNSNEFILNH